MYPFDYEPVINFSNLKRALKERFSFETTARELCDDAYVGKYIPFAILPTKQLGQYSLDVGLFQMFLKETLKIDFGMEQNHFLIYFDEVEEEPEEK